MQLRILAFALLCLPGSTSTVIAGNLEDIALEFEATIGDLANPDWTEPRQLPLDTADTDRTIGAATLLEMRVLEGTINTISTDNSNPDEDNPAEIVSKLLGTQLSADSAGKETASSSVSAEEATLSDVVNSIEALQGKEKQTLSDVVTALGDNGASIEDLQGKDGQTLSDIVTEIEGLKGSDKKTLSDIYSAIHSTSNSDIDDHEFEDGDDDDANYDTAKPTVPVADYKYSTESSADEKNNALTSISDSVNKRIDFDTTLNPIAVSETEDGESKDPCKSTGGVASFYCALERLFFPPKHDALKPFANASIKNTTDWACPDFEHLENKKSGYMDTTWMDLSSGKYQLCLGGSEKAAKGIVAFIFALVLIGSLYVGFGIAFN